MFICVYMCIWKYRFFWSPEEGVVFPVAGVLGSCEQPDVCWEPNVGPSQKPYVFLTLEISLQPWFYLLIWPDFEEILPVKYVELER